MFAGKVHHLRHFCFGHLVGEDAAFPDAMMMDVQHDLGCSLAILVVEGVERLVRNAWLKDKTPDDFNHSVRWIYGGNGLTGAKARAVESGHAA